MINSVGIALIHIRSRIVYKKEEEEEENQVGVQLHVLKTGFGICVRKIWVYLA